MTLTQQQFDRVNLAFTKQSEIYDEYESTNKVLHWMRQQVYRVALKYLNEGDKILELNSGTGTDAIFFAKNGFNVLATDLSDGMIEKIRNKILKEKLSDKIRVTQCSFTELEKLYPEKFDFIFSNFGGLNCADDLSEVIKHFPNLLNKGGRIMIVIMPPFCPWELVQIFRGKIKFALRRFNKTGAASNVEGIQFKTFYYSAGDFKKSLSNNFKVIYRQGLGIFTPVPQMEKFQKRFPRLLKLLNRTDEKLSRYFPFNLTGDHLILVAEYNPKTN
ncbi:class I SAM-dependent methyltransferase [Ignavibacterium sp.]|jgi:ubiquinone/menaquinone biosynthesis C-methylase UbiE|uniref:class I SAM-dependent methyltransferase n=1 Tax=Ignavibacterium sp. TaxID=2651167 RepID=UPI0025C45571|nr:class I SAM-dependent methyltransferase [Ignavibacterium sp.]